MGNLIGDPPKRSLAALFTSRWGKWFAGGVVVTGFTLLLQVIKLRTELEDIRKTQLQSQPRLRVDYVSMRVIELRNWDGGSPKLKAAYPEFKKISLQKTPTFSVPTEALAVVMCLMVSSTSSAGIPDTFAVAGKQFKVRNTRLPKASFSTSNLTSSLAKGDQPQSKEIVCAWPHETEAILIPILSIVDDMDKVKVIGESVLIPEYLRFRDPLDEVTTIVKKVRPMTEPRLLVGGASQRG